MSDPLPSERPSTLVAVLAAKGGCGATLLSVNLATSVDRTGDAVLVDLDFCKGDVAGFLDIWPEHSIKDALSDPSRLDAALLKGVAIHHASSGVDVLAQPFDLSELVQPRAREVQSLLAAARAGWPRVIADCGARLDEATLTAAMRADHIMLVTTPSVPALRDARRVLKLLTRLGVHRERLHLVVNRWVPSSAFDLDEIEHQLEWPVTATVASDTDATGKADYSGRPLTEVAPRAAISRDVDQLWTLLTGEENEETETGRLRRRWRFWSRRTEESP